MCSHVRHVCAVGHLCTEGHVFAVKHMRRLKGATLKGAAGGGSMCVLVCLCERERERALSEGIKASVIYAVSHN